MARKKLTKEQRIALFWSKVDIRGPSECWPWTAGAFRNGYGQFFDGEKHRRANRFAWEITHGPIPDGQCVLHHCDNPPCCNPGTLHLFLGTDGDNAADRGAKNRTARQIGTTHGMARLSEAQVAEIRSSGEMQKHLAARFGVSRGHISQIQCNKRWAHV